MKVNEKNCKASTGPLCIPGYCFWNCLKNIIKNVLVFLGKASKDVASDTPRNTKPFWIETFRNSYAIWCWNMELADPRSEQQNAAKHHSQIHFKGCLHRDQWLQNTTLCNTHRQSISRKAAGKTSLQAHVAFLALEGNDFCRATICEIYCIFLAF